MLAKIETLETVMHDWVLDLAVSPDERHFLLTVQGASDAVRDLWIFDRQSGEEKLLRAGAANAVWAPGR